MQVCGLEFTSETIHLIHQALGEVPSISRRSLAHRVCERMDWKSASGRFKETVCRKALGFLGRQGIIDLPPAAQSCRAGASSPNSAPVLPPDVQIDCALEDIGPIEIQMIGSRYTKLSRIWKNLMDSHHYLGSGPFCGAQLRYLVHSSAYGYIGAASFSSPAWALRKRDEFIGWTEAARRSNLQRLVSNSRFLIVPSVRVPNLASHVLGQCCRRIGGDWMARYGIEPVLLETFVDPKWFSGTSYRAANWVQVGPTSGRRGAQRQHGGGAKEIFLYPLRNDWRTILCAEPEIRLAQRSPGIGFADWAEQEFATVELYDPRLKRRLFSMLRDFYGQPQAAIPQACGSQAKTKAAYRFFYNKRVTMDRVLRAHTESSIARIQSQKVVLAVQDTTTLDYTTHPSTKDLGPISTRKSNALGLLVHDTMAFSEQGTPLGLLDVQCWARDPEDKGKKYRRGQLPIGQKESIKWLNSYRAVSQVQRLCPQTTLVSVGDRESDIYELFLEAQQDPQGPKLLVRCERTRNRKSENEYLWEKMARQPVSGIHVVRIPRKGCQLAREARLEVRHAQVAINAPNGKAYPPVTVWMVYAREVDPPRSVANPLEWMLLSTVEVHTLEQACERLGWYARRWGIEVYHRTLKSGCRIEDRQLETADSLQACLALDMVVAWRIYHLTMLSREVPEHPCSIFFEEAEWKALYILANQTGNLPAKQPSLRQATRMVASLGGFLGRKADGEPGTTTLWRGLQRIESAAAVCRLLLSQNTLGP
jgi:Domain of unknown function (DUF4338)/Transposase DNA-binding/Transposase Tn5 dimerisation domain